MVTAPKSLEMLALAVAKNTAAMAPSARYGAQNLKQELENSVKGLVLTPPSRPPLSMDLSSDEARGNRKDESIKKKPSHRKFSLF